MKKVAVLFLIVFVVTLIGSGIVSADPHDNPTAVTFDVTCQDGFSGEVVVPAWNSGPGGGPAGFFQGDLGGVGRPREIKITILGTDIVVEYWSQPGEGFETTDCSLLMQPDPEGPVFLVELKIQRFN